MSFILRLLLKTYNKSSKISCLSKIWWKLYRFFIKQYKNNPVLISIHNYRIHQPFDYTYPLYSRMFPTLNNPLIECVYQAALNSKNEFMGGGITLFDIGAAIGDTVLLIKSNCPAMVSKFYCIEGDREFFEYLTSNMAQFNDVKCINTVLSDSEEAVSSLVRIHPGTASAQGESKSEASTFDTVVEALNIDALDLLKIDTDGYDGKILKGAKNTLKKFHPVVIFEWHPILCDQAGTDYKDPFKILSNMGYTTFIWYTKKGLFTHFTYETTDDYIEQFAEICRNATFDSDWHYDIVALHSTSTLSVLNFANSDYSRNKRSPF